MIITMLWGFLVSARPDVMIAEAVFSLLSSQVVMLLSKPNTVQVEHSSRILNWLSSFSMVVWIRVKSKSISSLCCSLLVWNFLHLCFPTMPRSFWGKRTARSVNCWQLLMLQSGVSLSVKTLDEWMCKLRNSPSAVLALFCAHYRLKHVLK